MKPLTAALIAVQQNADLLKGTDGSPGKQGRPGIEGKAGDPGLTWRGTFAYGTTYQPGDVVEWEGSSYVALVVTARRPPDPDWDLLAAKGEPGASGRGYIRGGGGSGSGSALAVKDEGVSLTAAAASIDFAGAGVTATAVGTAVTVTIPGSTGDFIPQGGPLTADLDAGGFALTGTDGAVISVTSVVAANGGAGTGSTGAGFEANAGGLNVGGDYTVYGGNGSVEDGARIVVGGGSATDPGRVAVTTDNDTGSSGDLLTAQGDGTALWVPNAAQPIDATLTALAAANWAANAVPIGSGADALSQVAFAASTFPARASTGNLVAKTITDFGLSLIDDAAASNARTTLGLVIGTDVPAQSTFDDHSARHESGGGDAIKIDDLAAADDNTDLNVSTTKHGLTPKLPNDATKYLDGSGAYTVPVGSGGTVSWISIARWGL